MNRLRISAAFLVGCALVLTNCSSDEIPNVSSSVSSDKTLDPTSPVIAAQGNLKDSPATALEVTIGESNGCIMAGDMPVVWESGATWDDKTSEVVLPSGERLVVGDTVSGGGGSIPDPRAYFGNAVADRLEKCDSGTEALYLTT